MDLLLLLLQFVDHTTSYHRHASSFCCLCLRIGRLGSSLCRMSCDSMPDRDRNYNEAALTWHYKFLVLARTAKTSNSKNILDDKFTDANWSAFHTNSKTPIRSTHSIVIKREWCVRHPNDYLSSDHTSIILLRNNVTYFIKKSTTLD